MEDIIKEICDKLDEISAAMDEQKIAFLEIEKLVKNLEGQNNA